MRKALVLVIFTALAGAVMPTNALAAKWDLSGSPVTETTDVKAASTEAQFEDAKGTAEVPATVHCLVSEEGTVGPEGKGKITAFTVSSCTGVSVCETSGVTVKAIHLPWDTQLVETEKELRDKISSGGSGAPGWLIECLVIGITAKDECTGETSRAVENAVGGPETASDANSAKLSCSIGGAGTGLMIDSDLDEASSGTLSVESSIGGNGIQMRPFFWQFSPGEQKTITIINTNWFFKEEVVSGYLSSSGSLFELVSGQSCYNTNVVYKAKESCDVTIKVRSGARGTEELRLTTASEGTKKGSYEIY